MKFIVCGLLLVVCMIALSDAAGNLCGQLTPPRTPPPTGGDRTPLCCKGVSCCQCVNGGCQTGKNLRIFSLQNSKTSHCEITHEQFIFIFIGWTKKNCCAKNGGSILDILGLLGGGQGIGAGQGVGVGAGTGPLINIELLNCLDLLSNL